MAHQRRRAGLLNAPFIFILLIRHWSNDGRQRKAGRLSTGLGAQSRGMIDRRINVAADDANILRCTLPMKLRTLSWRTSSVAAKPLSGPTKVWRFWPSIVRVSDMAWRIWPTSSPRPGVPVMVLMQMKQYPADELKFLYYAQSASLTRFLLEQGRGGNSCNSCV